MMYRPACDSRFHVLGELGEGGTARVVRAFDTQLHRQVAVKSRNPDADIDDETFRALVHREAQLIKHVKAPQIVNLLSSPSPSYSHLVLELCPGPTLQEIGRVTDFGMALNLISALALSLETVHALGIIHGDLKPHNVFLPRDWSVTTGRGLFWLQISDFSLGRQRGQSDRERLGRGTVGYMAPETIVDGATSVQSDLFALGVIAYRLLSGHHPFHNGESEPVIVNSRVRESAHVPISELCSEAGTDLTGLVDELLAKAPEDRPGSAWEVCQRLEACGATYDFRRALRPSHLLSAERSYEDNEQASVCLDPHQADNLKRLTGSRVVNLRLLLSSNFDRGHLEYRDGRFTFTGPILWPHRCRGYFLQKYADGSFGERRQMVKEAITVGTKQSALDDLLIAMLKPVTITAVAKRALRADTADHRDGQAVDLRLRAGRYREAIDMAKTLADDWDKSDQADRAIGLLSMVTRVAAQSGYGHECRPLYCTLGNLHKKAGALDRALEDFESAIGHSRDRYPDATLAEAHKGLGETYRLRMDTERCLEHLNRALDVSQQLGDELEVSHIHNNLGNAYWVVSDFKSARREYLRALKIQKRLQAKFEIASTTHNVASLFCLDGRIKRGTLLLEHALRLKRDLSDKGEIARTLNNLSYAYSLQGKSTQAAECVAESLQLNRAIGSKKELLFNLENTADLTVRAAQLSTAEKQIDEGLALSEELKDESHRAVFEYYRGTARLHQGRFGDAEAAFAEARRLTDATDDNTLYPRIDANRARLREAIGDREGAVSSARCALEQALNVGDTASQLESFLLIVRWTGDGAAVERAKALIDDFHSVREAHLLRFALLYSHFDGGYGITRTDCDREILRSPLRLETDIELPWMMVLGARIGLAAHEYELGTTLADRAESICRSGGLLPALVEVLIVQGQLASATERYEQAYGRYREALSLSRAVCDGIAGAKDRTRYQQTRAIQTLATEIKSLGAKLGGAAVPHPGAGSLS